MKVLLLNQYGPPDIPPTAQLAADLATRLRTAGHEVEIVSTSTAYGERRHQTTARGKNELKAHSAIYRQAKNKKVDLILAFSSPPCLLITAARLSRKLRIPLVHWALDLYPDIAVSLRAIRIPLLPSILRFLMRRAYRQCAAVVALDADMQSYLRTHYNIESEIIPPWPPAVATVTLNPPSKPWMWLYSGNLGRAHEWESLLAAQSLLEKKSLAIDLVFQGSGAGWSQAKAAATNLKLQRCHWRGYAPDEELVSSLLSASVLIITQKIAATGQLWPSKLALAQLLSIPILWVGPTNGSIAASLRQSPVNGIFSPDQAGPIAAWIEEKFLNSKPVSVSAADLLARIRSARSENLDLWEKIISRLSKTPGLN